MPRCVEGFWDLDRGFFDVIYSISYGSSDAVDKNLGEKIIGKGVALKKDVDKKRKSKM